MVSSVGSVGSIFPFRRLLPCILLSTLESGLRFLRYFLIFRVQERSDFGTHALLAVALLLLSLSNAASTFVRSLISIKTRKATAERLLTQLLQKEKQAIASNISLDLSKIEDFIKNASLLVVTPIEICGWLLLFWRNSGWYAGVCVTVATGDFLLLFLLLNSLSLLDKARCNTQKEAMGESVGQILDSLYVIRVHRWQSIFRKRVESLRAAFQRTLDRTLILRQLSVLACSTFTPLVVLALVWIHFSFYGRPVGGLLLRELLIVFAVAECIYSRLAASILSIADYKVAKERVIKLLPTKQPIFYWAESQLRRICTNATGMTAITGDSGGGKSVLLAEIASFMQQQAERVFLFGDGQVLLNSTIEENILFGNQPNPERLQKILDCCCLSRDVASLPGGLQFSTGSDGCRLSGGQRYRVLLARAIYGENFTVFCFDNFLRSLNQEMAITILKAARSLLGDCVIFVVSTEPLVVSQCDRVVNLTGVCEFEVFQQDTRPELPPTTEDAFQTDPAADGKASPPAAIRPQLISGARVFWICCGLLIFGCLPEILKLMQLNWSREWGAGILKHPDSTCFLVYALFLVPVVFIYSARVTVFRVAARRFCLSTFSRLIGAILEKIPWASLSSLPRLALVDVFAKDLLFLDENFAFIVNESVQCVCTGLFIILTTTFQVSKNRLLWISIFLFSTATVWLAVRLSLARLGNRLKEQEAERRVRLLEIAQLLQSSNTTQEQQQFLTGKYKRSLSQWADASKDFSWCALATCLVFDFACSVLQFLLFVFFKGDFIQKAALYAAALKLSDYLQWSLRVSFDWVDMRARFNRITGILRWERGGQPQASYNEQNLLVAEGVSCTYEGGLRAFPATSFSFSPGDNVAVVGRSGCGKSSLLFCIFGLIHPSTGQVSFPTESPQFSVAPQEPKLASGSWRFNLDASVSAGDDEIWEAISAAGLKGVSSLDSQIAIASGTDVFRVALAQILLRREASVVLLDETIDAFPKEERHSLIRRLFKVLPQRAVKFFITHDTRNLQEFDSIISFGCDSVTVSHRPKCP